MDDQTPRGDGDRTAASAEGDAVAPLAAFHDFEPQLDDFETAVLDGLSRPAKELPCKFLYDERGSRLFDDICTLEEYYPTRTEIAVLRARAPRIAELIGGPCHLVEYGSGSSVKVRILLDALPDIAAYTPVDISKDHLIRSAASLARDFPKLKVIAVCADYTRPFEIPPLPDAPDAERVVFFPGSTIGNFPREQAESFLAATARVIGPGGALLIGVDLRKDRRVLEAAYNDSKGVTAAFNMNLLARINRELGADFDLAGFRHRAQYDEAAGRVDMHLVSLRRQSVHVDGATFAFGKDEAIHTELSYKYALDEFRALARAAGFTPVESWTDEKGLFSVHFFRT